MEERVGDLKKILATIEDELPNLVCLIWQKHNCIFWAEKLRNWTLEDLTYDGHANLYTNPIRVHRINSLFPKHVLIEAMSMCGKDITISPLEHGILNSSLRGICSHLQKAPLASLFSISVFGDD